MSDNAKASSRAEKRESRPSGEGRLPKCQLGGDIEGTTSKRAQRQSTALVVGQHPSLGRLLAAVDSSVHHVTGRVETSRLGAMLAPFRTAEEARSALIAAGATIEGGERG